MTTLDKLGLVFAGLVLAWFVLPATITMCRRAYLRGDDSFRKEQENEKTQQENRSNGEQ